MICVEDLFVSSVEGQLASRPSAGRSLSAWIGAYPAYKNGQLDGIRWETSEIVMIPAASVAEHLKAWSRVVESGSVKLRTKAEYDAFLAKQSAESEAEGKKLAEEAKVRRAKEEADAKLLAEKLEKEQIAREKQEAERAAKVAADEKARQAKAEELARKEAEDLAAARAKHSQTTGSK
jgi:hypothetical protein